MKKIILPLFVLGINASAFAQNVGIGSTNFTPNSSALLELRSTTSGFLMPRMSLSQISSISVPAEGLLVYQTNGTKGFKYYDGSSWMPFDGAGGADNFGSHTAEENIRLNDFWLSNNGGDEGIKITDDGKVGFGTADPAYQFHLSGTGINAGPISSTDQILARFEQNNTSKGAGIQIKGYRALSQVSAFVDLINYDSNVSNEYIMSRIAGLTEDDGEKGSIVLYTNSGGADDSGLTEKVRITSGGKFGIGTSDPNSELEVVGGARITDLAGSGTRMVVADASGNLSTQDITSTVSGALDAITRAVSSASGQTSSSSSNSNLNSMSLSVEPGRYIFQFNCDMEVSNGNTVGEFSFAVNGITISDSKRRIKPGTNSPGIATLMTVVDVESSGTVKVQFRRESGSGTVRVGGRTLMAMRISN